MVWAWASRSCDAMEARESGTCSCEMRGENLQLRDERPRTLRLTSLMAAWAIAGVCDADRQPRRRDPARAAGARRSRRARLRGHAAHAGAARSPRHPRGVAGEPARAQRTRPRARAGGAGARGGDGRAGQRRGHAAGLRPRLRAGAGVHPRGPAGRGAAGAERGGGSARRLGSAGRALAVRGVPAAQAQSSSSVCWRRPRRRSSRSSLPGASPPR